MNSVQEIEGIDKLSVLGLVRIHIGRAAQFFLLSLRGFVLILEMATQACLTHDLLHFSFFFRLTRIFLLNNDVWFNALCLRSSDPTGCSSARLLAARHPGSQVE